MFKYTESQDEVAQNFKVSGMDDQQVYFTMLAGSWYTTGGGGYTSSSSNEPGLLESGREGASPEYHGPFHPPEVGHSWEKYMQFKKSYYPRKCELLIQLLALCQEKRWQ